MFEFVKKYILVALLIAGSAILLYSCKENETNDEEPLEMIKTEESENLTVAVSENGRRSYRFHTPLLEGYTLGRDPYREFRRGIDIITYKDDSMSVVNATLVANYAIYYENRKLWEAKGNVVVTKSDGTRLYTQQIFWNSITKRIYSNVDTKVVTDTDTFIGEGFESDEELKELHFRRFKSKMRVDTAMQSEADKETEGADEARVSADDATAGVSSATAVKTETRERKIQPSSGTESQPRHKTERQPVKSRRAPSESAEGAKREPVTKPDKARREQAAKPALAPRAERETSQIAPAAQPEASQIAPASKSEESLKIDRMEDMAVDGALKN